MGRASRPKPVFLASKLKKIREELEIGTLDEMISRLNSPDVSLYRSHIREYENGTREPPLLVLLKYSRLAGVHLEVLVDDDLELPSVIPTKEKSGGVQRMNSSD